MIYEYIYGGPFTSCGMFYAAERLVRLINKKNLWALKLRRNSHFPTVTHYMLWCDVLSIRCMKKTTVYVYTDTHMYVYTYIGSVIIKDKDMKQHLWFCENLFMSTTTIAHWQNIVHLSYLCSILCSRRRFLMGILYTQSIFEILM